LPESEAESGAAGGGGGCGRSRGNIGGGGNAGGFLGEGGDLLRRGAGEEFLADVELGVGGRGDLQEFVLFAENQDFGAGVEQNLDFVALLGARGGRSADADALAGDQAGFPAVVELDEFLGDVAEGAGGRGDAVPAVDVFVDLDDVALGQLGDGVVVGAGAGADVDLVAGDDGLEGRLLAESGRVGGEHPSGDADEGDERGARHGAILRFVEPSGRYR
jgi:hypothetical protein